jgi:hypothetical protein
MQKSLELPEIKVHTTSPMKDPITLLLRLLGYKVRKPSLLLMHMVDVTHGSWLADRNRQSNLDSFLIKK